MDPSAAQIEAQCVGQLSTLITTLLVLWRKILGHNGELERVNDVVTVHRKSVENDSKKRELSSAERKRLYVVLYFCTRKQFFFDKSLVSHCHTITIKKALEYEQH